MTNRAPTIMSGESGLFLKSSINVSQGCKAERRRRMKVLGGSVVSTPTRATWRAKWSETTMNRWFWADAAQAARADQFDADSFKCVRPLSDRQDSNGKLSKWRSGQRQADFDCLASARSILRSILASRRAQYHCRKVKRIPAMGKKAMSQVGTWARAAAAALAGSKRRASASGTTCQRKC